MKAHSSSWPDVALGEVCEFKYGKSLPESKRAGGNVAVYGSNGVVGQHNEAITDGLTIVVGRKGSFGEVNLSHAPCWPIDTTYYIDRTATNADLRWLAYRLKALGLTELNKAAAVPGLNREDAYRKRLLLPPSAEQRRIAAILDQAEALRAKRRHALAQLDTLTQSLFLNLFGDPVTNAKGWSTAFLNDLLAMPLRNGLSPSNSGEVKAKVLTLSAITSDAFRADAWKEAPFQSVPPSDQRVDASDLLICRGNGNVRLVGKGYFPPCDMPDLTFPDTMIAARVSGDRVAPDFLQVLWNGSSVRRQIESLARTTNGTFKVNQTMLESIWLIAPPLPLQRKFATQVSAVERLKTTQRSSLAKLDALFASLQHRAFRGEL